MTPDHLDLLLEHPDLADLDAADRRLAIRSLVAEARVPDPLAVASALSDYVDGFGPLTALMDDERVTDVLVNGPTDVWVERDGNLQPTSVTFGGADELREFVQMLAGRSGRSVDVTRPIADARLADGSRMHVVLPPIAPDGPLVSIRRFAPCVMMLDDLLTAGMMNEVDAARIAAFVADRSNLVIAGATGAGKTTLLNALLALVSSTERVITIEETPELRPTGGHIVSLLARGRNVEGTGEVDLAELVRAALRMRPDRIVVGEVRGAEMLAALGALSTGHEGSLITVHARSVEDVPARLLSLALQAAGAPSERALRAQIRSAFDTVVFVRRVLGRRVVDAIRPMT